MHETLRRICELQPYYSAENTEQMRERGRLVRQELTGHLRDLAVPLSEALGDFGADFNVDASDGIGRKTELPWARFYSEHMSPSATQGFYCVVHFSTDGLGVHIAVGCSSSKFKEGYSVVLPPGELNERTSWARRIVLEERGSLNPFTDENNFGASRSLPKSFERASALVKTVRAEDIKDEPLDEYLITAAQMLRLIYSAQRDGRELSPADQDELSILEIARPTSKIARGQGFGLSTPERKVVELRAMDLAREWLINEGYIVSDTSASMPYDFEAKRADEILIVEVKGTTSAHADAISMTHTEVAVHKEQKGTTALFLVSAIRLMRDPDNPSASGGTLEVLKHWDIDEWMIKPTVFRVERKVHT